MTDIHSHSGERPHSVDIPTLDWLLGTQPLEGNNDYSQLFGLPISEDLFGIDNNWNQFQS